MAEVGKFQLHIFTWLSGGTAKGAELVQACLHAPPVVSDEAKLAIVFTYFFLLLLLFLIFLLSFSPPYTFHPLRGISRA